MKLNAQKVSLELSRWKINGNFAVETLLEGVDIDEIVDQVGADKLLDQIGRKAVIPMQIVFVLSMPGCSSWNGKWSGEGRLYCVIKNYSRSKKRIEKAEKMVSHGSYSYNFGDGWRAQVDVKKVSASEARKMRKASVGFAGYEWMIDSIELHDKIYADHDEIPKKEEPTAPAPVVEPVTADAF